MLRDMKDLATAEPRPSRVARCRLSVKALFEDLIILSIFMIGGSYYTIFDAPAE